MATPYLSEIRMMAFNFPPKGWALCNGQLLAIQQYTALFSLLGTTYGGDGIRTFALPNLQGNVPLGYGTNPAGGGSYVLGELGGEASHTLVYNEMAAHTHTLRAVDGAPTTGQPGPSVALSQGIAKQSSGTVAAYLYGNPPADISMASSTIGQSGGSQPHPNQQPFLVINFCIALTGIFPSPN